MCKGLGRGGRTKAEVEYVEAQSHSTWIRTYSADSLARHGFLGGEASERNSASSASASVWGKASTSSSQV